MRSSANLNVISHPRGRGRVLPRVLEEVLDEAVDHQKMGASNRKDPIVVDSPIVGAALRLVYQLAYGDGDDCSESVSDRQDDEKDSDNESEFSLPDGLVFLDDKEILLDDVLDDDLFRTSFPKNKSVSKHYAEGGPQPPDLSVRRV